MQQVVVGAGARERWHRWHALLRRARGLVRPRGSDMSGSATTTTAHPRGPTVKEGRPTFPSAKPGRQPPPDDPVWADLISQGAHLVRCNRGTKRPIGKSWQKHSPNTRAIARGIREGEAIGIVPTSLGCAVLDVDVPKKDGKPTGSWDARVAFANDRATRALTALGDPEPLVVARTPSGGLHVWLRCKRSEGNRRWGLPDDRTHMGEVRGGKGQVIGWGDAYVQLLAALHAERGTPVASLEALPKPRDARLQEKIAAQIATVAAAQEGTRHDTLLEVADDLAARGQLDDALEQRLREAALAAGLGADEATRTIDDAKTWGKDHPRGRRAEAVRQTERQDRLDAVTTAIMRTGTLISLPPYYGSPSGLWRLAGSTWFPYDQTLVDADIRQRLAAVGGKQPSAADVRECAKWVAQRTVPRGASTPPPPPVGRAWRLPTGELVAGTPFSNALVGVSAGGEVRVSKLSAEIFAPVPPLPVAWPDAVGPTPLFDRFLRETLDGSGVAVEWMAAQIGRALCPRLVPQVPTSSHAHAAEKVAVLLIGPARTGKGALLRIVAALTGSGQVADRADQFGGRFGTSELLRRRVILIRDMQRIPDRHPPDLASSLSVLKSLIDQEPVSVELKGERYRPLLDWEGSVWIASNHDAPFATSSADLDSWIDRLAPVHCGNSRPPNAREEGLAERIVAEEGASVARRCVEAYAALVRGEIAAVPDQVEAKRTAMLANTLPAYERCVRETFAADPDDGKLYPETVQAAIDRWSRQNREDWHREDGHPPYKEIYQALLRLGGKRRRYRHGGYVWTGLALRH